MTHHTVTAKQSTPRQSTSRFKFFGEAIAELKKVVWLSRRQVAYLTSVVILISILAGLVLGAVDYGFTRLVNDIFLGG